MLSDRANKFDWVIYSGKGWLHLESDGWLLNLMESGGARTLKEECLSYFPMNNKYEYNKVYI